VNDDPNEGLRDLFWPCLLFLVAGTAFFIAALFVG
jgi:hypothetical protein